MCIVSIGPQWLEHWTCVTEVWVRFLPGTLIPSLSSLVAKQNIIYSFVPNRLFVFASGCPSVNTQPLGQHSFPFHTSSILQGLKKPFLGTTTLRLTVFNFESEE